MIHLFKLNKGSGEEAVENTTVGNGFYTYMIVQQ